MIAAWLAMAFLCSGAIILGTRNDPNYRSAPITCTVAVVVIMLFIWPLMTLMTMFLVGQIRSRVTRGS